MSSVCKTLNSTQVVGNANYSIYIDRNNNQTLHIGDGLRTVCDPKQTPNGPFCWDVKDSQNVNMAFTPAQVKNGVVVNVYNSKDVSWSCQ